MSCTEAGDVAVAPAGGGGAAARAALCLLPAEPLASKAVFVNRHGGLVVMPDTMGAPPALLAARGVGALALCDAVPRV